MLWPIRTHLLFSTNQEQQQKTFSRAWHRLHALLRVLIGSLYDLHGCDWPDMISRLSTFVLLRPRYFQNCFKLWMKTVTNEEVELNECLKIAVQHEFENTLSRAKPPHSFQDSICQLSNVSVLTIQSTMHIYSSYHEIWNHKWNAD